ncbi:MAG: hypothetical protein KDD63_00370 [Bacteroidetes bacterium]|nr:hypothetical protein [Bacteroidota bacterium]
MKANFLNQFMSQPSESFVGKLESRTRVFLLYARYQGKPVYYYLQLPSHRQQRFRQMLKVGKAVKPSQHGQILACGYGSPSPTLQKRMAQQFQVYPLLG